MSLVSSLLTDVVSSGATSLLTKNTGIAEGLIKKAAVAAVPVLLKGVLNTAKTGGKGAEGLLTSLLSSKAAGGSVLDALTNGKLDDGLKLVSGLFGKHEGSIVDELTKHIGDAGVGAGEVKNLLGSLAPGVFNSIASNVDISDKTNPADLLGTLGKAITGEGDVSKLKDLAASGFGIESLVSQAAGGLDLDHVEGLWDRIKHFFTE